jgi:predicted RNase H-like HicB family nuclease
MQKKVDSNRSPSDNGHEDEAKKRNRGMATAMKNNSITFKVDICVEEDGQTFYAYCPALKGIHIDGQTREEALQNVKTAIVLYIESLIKHGDAIPLQTIEDSRPLSNSVACSSPQRHTEDIRIAI